MHGARPRPLPGGRAGLRLIVPIQVSLSLETQALRVKLRMTREEALAPPEADSDHDAPPARAILPGRPISHAQRHGAACEHWMCFIRSTGPKTPRNLAAPLAAIMVSPSLTCICFLCIVGTGGLPIAPTDNGFGFGLISQGASLLVASETPAPASTSPGEPPDTDAPSESESSERTVGLSTLSCVLAVILFTVVFEKGREALKEAAERGPFEPVLNTLFGELSILGFIGLVAFLVTNPKVAYCHAEQPHHNDSLADEPEPNSTTTGPDCSLMGWASTKIFSGSGEEAATELPEIFESIHMIIFGNM